MAELCPFAAYLAENSAAEKVATLPYDVMNRQEAAVMAADNPACFLRVTRSELELPATVTAYEPAVYEQARQNWLRISQRYLHLDKIPAYYIYALTRNGRRQFGVVSAASVQDYDNNIIRKHERTRKEKEDDRTRHISSLRAQTGAVFLTYKDSTAVDALVKLACQEKAIFDFIAEDGIRHCGWRLPQQYTEAMRQAFAEIPLLYIADGHHRAASASRTYAQLAAEGIPGKSGHFLLVTFPASQLCILPYNRIVTDLHGLSETAFLAVLQACCQLQPAAAPEPDTAGQLAMYWRGQWWKLSFPDIDYADCIASLDVSLLQDRILAPILGIDDPRTSDRIDFVGGIRGTAELSARVDAGEGVLAFSMYPTSLEQLMAIADANEIMPPKSTWFEPKLRDGLFVHAI